jgi:cytochrome d ubiquinol oxidase subunit I
MPTGTFVPILLLISAFGIYIHAFFLSISLGLPWIILGLVYKWWRTEDEDYYDAARTATNVLGVNFALGAITGTLVEFGLVQAWPGTIFVIATFGFVPLTLELVAFVGEVLFLIMFIVTLRKVTPTVSIAIMALYAIMAVFSGAVITTVNSWMNVPSGTANLATYIYPFLPQYGPSAVDIQALVKMKVQLIQSLLTSGSSSQVLQNSTLAGNLGITLTDPFVGFYSQYAWASMLHAVNAGIIVGISFGLAGYAYRFLRSGNAKYVKIMRAFLPILLILLVLQPTVFGDFMGKTVATSQPTKFALMEGAENTTQNPLIAFLAYGDPQHSIPGLQDFKRACEDNKNKTLGEVASSVVPGLNTGPASSINLKDLCLSDLSKAETEMVPLNSGYYAKIASGVVALISIIALVALNFSLGPLSTLTEFILKPFGRRKAIPLLSFLVLSGCVLAASLGWFVREVGRTPWTVYGLLYPEELITPVPMNPIVLGLFVATFLTVAVVGIYGMYLVATRPLRFIELLRKGAGVE